MKYLLLSLSIMLAGCIYPTYVVIRPPEKSQIKQPEPHKEQALPPPQTQTQPQPPPQQPQIEEPERYLDWFRGSPNQYIP